MRTSLLALVLPIGIAACSVNASLGNTNQDETEGSPNSAIASEISLPGALQGMIASQGSDGVKATLHQFLASKLSDPDVLSLVDAQVDPYIDAIGSGATPPPFPVVPFSILPTAQSIFAQAPGSDPPLPAAKVFDLDPSTSTCKPVRSQLTPVNGIPGLSTGSPDNPNVDDCSLAYLEAFTDALNGISMGDGTTVIDGTHTYTNVNDVFAALLATHTITVEANRYFANFLGLYANGQSIAAPVWVDTGIPLPAGGTLIVPAPHSGYSFHFSGPSINGSVEFYMGLSVGTKFYPYTSTPRPAWSGGRAQYTYSSGTDDAKILSIVSTAAALRKKWTNEALYPTPLTGMGYGILGVCMDSAAVIEEVTEGTITLFPLAHPKPKAIDDDLDAVLAKLPTDLAGFDPKDAAARIATSMPMSNDALQTEFPLVASEMASLNLTW